MSNFLRFSGSNGNNGSSGNNGRNGKNQNLNQDVLEIKQQHGLFAQALEISKQIKDQSSYTEAMKEQDLIIQLSLANSIQAVKDTFQSSANKPKPK